MFEGTAVIVKHHIYGEGRVVDDKGGLFIGVRFKKELPGILGRRVVSKGILHVGRCACVKIIGS